MLSRRDILFWPLALAVSEGDPRDEWYWATVQKRTAPAYFLFGDSIARGYGLGGWADQILPTHPLYEFRSIASMARLALQESGRAERLGMAGNLMRDEQTLSNICYMVNEGIIRSGDTVIFEDAGDYLGSSIQYRDELLGFHAALPAGVHCIMMTMFDYSSDPAFQFDTPDSTGLSRNDAIRAAAMFSGATLLDMNAIMDQWRSSALGQDGVDVMLPGDPIHPNVWGQMMMTGEILKAAGLRSCLSTVSGAVQIAEANWQVLAYGSPYFTQSRAGQFVQHCLLR